MTLLLISSTVVLYGTFLVGGTLMVIFRAVR